MSRRQERTAAIAKGLHAERVAKNPRYYAQLNDHPNYRQFKKAEYVDDAGRQYKVATTDLVRTDTPRQRPSWAPVKLYVRLPPGTEWFPNKPRVSVTLYSTDGTQATREVIIRKRMIMPQHRTGHAYVAPTDWM